MKILNHKGFPPFVFLAKKTNKCVFLSAMVVVTFAWFPSLIAAEQELSLKQMLLTPGDLVEGHADIENKCESCHVHFEKSNQTPLCLDCHEEINDDIKTKTAFHGQISDKGIKDCKNCHTDHKGRDFDITGLDKDNFDHSMTDFTLQGSHSNLECSSCHTALKKPSTQEVKGLKELPVGEGFRFKIFECDSCHVDFHEEALGSECDSCHNSKAWTSSDFEHDKTDFPLDGRHKNLQCNSCHIDNRLEKIDTQCQSCHLAKEPHLGVFGTECADCHSAEQWKPKSYNHRKETGYQLKGSHFEHNGKALACIACHSEELKPATQCIGCHSDDDTHQGANGDSCQNCHNQKEWDKTDFVHDFATTGFILTGEHRKVDCESCHLPGELRELSNNKTLGLVRNCIDCHQTIDPHFSQLGKDCGNCHQTDGWLESVRFNHDFSDFPLTGSHQLLVCDACHISSEFSDQSQKCVSCHLDDDVHEQTLGDNCDSCHDTSVWSHWQFDHQRQTKFALDGAHQDLECKLCHNEQMRDPLKPGTRCINCHRDDDVHNEGFGIECQECHSQVSFEELAF